MQITDEDVVRTLREVVAERPDYVYAKPAHMEGTRRCFYVHPSEDGNPSQPGCLVGHVLNRLGADLHTLARYEGADAEYLVGELELPLSGETVNLLVDAQTVQDDGRTWAESLEAADAAADERREEAGFNELEEVE